MEALYQDSLDEHDEQLAYHYERSAAEDKAVEYLLKAGEKARRAYHNEAAISYFQRALDRLDASPSAIHHAPSAMEWRLERVMHFAGRLGYEPESLPQ